MAKVFLVLQSLAFIIVGFLMLIYIDFYPQNLILPVEQFEISKSNWDDLTREEKDNLSKIYYKIIDIDDIPSFCVNALTSIEDKYYWSNFGVDLNGMGRMVLSLIPRTNIRSGGSTITQQVIKMGNNKFYDRNIIDKTREILWSIKLSASESKTKVLERYLNNAYWGDYNYGIEQASVAYFNKPVSSLNLAECSYLVGILQVPNAYNPKNNIFPVEGKNRQYWVLNQMFINSKITQVEFSEAYGVGLGAASD
jgi:membrane peptidoglycan carboxypeptidase